MFRQRTCSKLNRFIRKTWKSFVIITAGLLFLYFIYNIHPLHISPKNTTDPYNKDVITAPTNINHLCFRIAGSSKTWNCKRGYIQSWWRPYVTRGFIFMEKTPVEHLPWPSNYPPLCISEDNSQYKDYDRHDMRFAIRMVRVIEQTFFEGQNEGGVRWLVMADDDIVFLLDNLVRVLSKYDHTKHFYVGMISECVVSNSLNSFEMVFGGEHGSVFGSDHILQSCVADMRVSLTQERGFHQRHLRIPTSLSPPPRRGRSHISIDGPHRISEPPHESIIVGPIENAATKIVPPSFLVRPLKTFIPWRKGAKPPYMFNTRRVTLDDPCDNACPHLFYFDDGSVDREIKKEVMHYRRRDLRQCNSTGYHREAEHIARIRVISSSDGYKWQDGSRRECCDVAQLRVGIMDYVEVKLWECEEDEIIVA